MHHIKVKDLLGDINRLMEQGDITEESEVVIGHYTKGAEGLIEDLYYWGVDVVQDVADDDSRKGGLEIQAYREPLE